jgi:hypothetical protein
MKNSERELLEIYQDTQELVLKLNELFNKIERFCKTHETIITNARKNRRILLKYQIVFEDYTMWESRKDYYQIIESFLNTKTNGEDFVTQILSLRRQNMTEAKLLEDNLESKTDFHLTSKSIGFARVIDNIYFVLDLFDSTKKDSESNPYCLSENGLRDEIKKIFDGQFSKYYSPS